jgi:hypothetical protein
VKTKDNGRRKASHSTEEIHFSLQVECEIEVGDFPCSFFFFEKKSWSTTE